MVLMAAGGNCYDDMRVLGADEGLQRLIGYELPSPDAVRTYANALHDEGLIEQAKGRRPRGAVAYIPTESQLLAGLAEVNVALCRAVAAQQARKVRGSGESPRTASRASGARSPLPAGRYPLALHARHGQ